MKFRTKRNILLVILALAVPWMILSICEFLVAERGGIYQASRSWYVKGFGGRYGALESEVTRESGKHGAWETQAGPSVFAPFPADTDYFAADRQWMLNLRVDDLDGLCASLRAAGIEVITNPEWDVPGVGRFAHTHDPEGNPIELWQPDESA